MAGNERSTGAQYRRALVTLAAVLVVGGASLTSPTILSSHSTPPSNADPSAPLVSPAPGTSPTPTNRPPSTVQGTSDPVEAPTTSVPTITPTPTVTMTNLPQITTKRVSVPFTTVTHKDAGLHKGKTKVVRAGVNGLKEVTYTDGKVTATKVIKKPVSKLVAIGTKTTQPWLSNKQCGVEGGRHPFVRVTVSDPDKVGYRLTLTWGKESQVFKKSGTNTFELRPRPWSWAWWWGSPPCNATLG